MNKASAVAVLGWVLGTPIWAQDALSLRDAVRMALAGSPSVEASAASKDAASAGITQARSGFFPRVDYSESWTRSDNPVFVFSSLLTQHQFSEQNFLVGPLNRPDFLNNFQSVLSADQPLYDAGKTKRAIRSAEWTKDITAENDRQTRMELIANVVRSYSNAQLGMEQLETARRSIRFVEADLERAETRRAAGMATDADVLSIRVHLAGVEEERIRRAADLDVARAALNDALGAPLDTAHTLTTLMLPLDLAVLSVEEYEQQSSNARPEARQARIGVDLARSDVADARGSLLPQVDLHSAFEADRQRFFDRGGANWLVSIGLKWNLFNGLRDKARIQASESTLRRRTAEQERADSAIRLQVRQAWAALRAATQRIETMRAAQAEAEETLRISQNRYEAGLSTVTDLLRVETALLETRTRYAAAVHDQRVAAAMLELAAGMLSVDSEVLN